MPSDGVPDMTVISEIDEYGINTNIKVRYMQNRIYVSVQLLALALRDLQGMLRFGISSTDIPWYNPGGCEPLPPDGHL